MNGILLINKPQGWTSFDVIGKLRGILHMKRLGHAGTLDPMATGVLPVFVGYATKACGILPDDTKAYTAGFRLGQVSDTLDCTGTILETHEIAGITAEQITALFSGMTGEVMQLPPMYSAVKVDGKKLYELARQGKTVERTPRKVRIDELKLTAYDPAAGTGTLQIKCGSGTYVRTVIDDLGQALGCGALMTSLCRTLSNNFIIDRCITIEQAQALSDAGSIETAIIPIAEVFRVLPPLHLNEEQTRLYRNGVKLRLNELKLLSGGRFAVYGTPDGFLGTAIADRENQILRIERNLKEPQTT
ncbi:MAG: tRNA pseudouridine(55) synthase TruB [Oscillospiraceae bacterium]|nr:tRNA pseudouridine(55) synthase TruB [Oscillospiraceae bacterium]